MKNNLEEINISDLFSVIRKNYKIIILITVCCTLLLFILSSVFIQKKYSSSSMLYVINKQSETGNLNINDITVAQKLVVTCKVIFTSDTIFNKAINELNLPYSAEQLRKMVAVSAVNQTEVIKITVTDTDSTEAYDIANKLTELAQPEFVRIVKSGTIEVIDNAKENKNPVSPNVLIFTVIGLFLGLAGSVLLFFIKSMLDTSVKENDDLAEMYNIPVLSEVVNFDLDLRGEY